MSCSHLPTQKIGSFTVTAISDGHLTASLDFLSNIDPAEATRQIKQTASPEPPDAIHINCYLIQGNGRKILIDAGAGGIKQWGGRLFHNLLKIGINPSEIDTVLLTHAHPDHIGGLLDTNGHSTLPNAEIIISQLELNFWQDDGNLSRAKPQTYNNFQIARQMFSAYHDRVRPITNGNILPEVTAIPLLGHTAGHTGYRLESDNHSLLIWGDIVHYPEVQISHPNVSIAFDLDQSLAAQTRSKLFDLVSSERLPIAGMHLREPGFGYIKRKGTSYNLIYSPAL